MRDPRLDRHPAYLAAERRARDARIRAEGIAESATLVSELVQWCREVLFPTSLMSTGSDEYALSDLLTLLPTELPTRAFSAVSDVEERRAIENGMLAVLEGRSDDQRDVAAWLFGDAIAKALDNRTKSEHESIEQLLRKMWELVKSDDLVRRGFTDSLRAGLKDFPSVVPTILSTLKARIDEISNNPGMGVFARERDEFKATLAAWREYPSLDRVWADKDRWFPVHYDFLEIVPHILPVARNEILKHLDRFDFPHPIFQVLASHLILHDRDEIAELLRAAPLCSEDGHSWNGSLSAVLVLKTVEDHCDALWREVRSQETSEDAGAKSMKIVQAVLLPWLEELATILMARRDSVFLAPQWLLLKVTDERLDRARYGFDGSRSPHQLPQDSLIEWIASALVKRGLAASRIASRVVFPTAQEPSRSTRRQSAPKNRHTQQPRLGALYMMCLVNHMIGDAGGDEGEEILQMLDTLLVSRDPAFEVESSFRDGLPASCFGYLLSIVENPALRWRQSWDSLAEQRRRAEHWSQTDDGDSLAPTLFLLSVGVLSICWLLSEHSSSPMKARRLWRELFDRARECWLTISLSHLVEPIENHIQRLFVWHPSVFGGGGMQTNEADVDTAGAIDEYTAFLAQDLDFLGGDDRMLTICCLNAYRNGAGEYVMARLLAHDGGRISAMLSQFEEWQAVEREVRKSTHILKALSEMRGKIAKLN